MNGDAIRRMMEKMEDTFRDLERDFDEQFGNQIRGRIAEFPIDIEETDQSVIVRADLPGIEKDQIDVNVAENTVNIRAQDEHEVKEEGKNYVRQERRTKNYQRSVRLPVSVDPDSADATYNKGVLSITLTKTSESQGTGVEVK